VAVMAASATTLMVRERVCDVFIGLAFMRAVLALLSCVNRQMGMAGPHEHCRYRIWAMRVLNRTFFGRCSETQWVNSAKQVPYRTFGAHMNRAQGCFSY